MNILHDEILECPAPDGRLIRWRVLLVLDPIGDGNSKYFVYVPNAQAQGLSQAEAEKIGLEAAWRIWNVPPMRALCLTDIEFPAIACLNDPPDHLEDRPLSDEEIAVMRASMDRMLKMFADLPPPTKTMAEKVQDAILLPYLFVCWCFAIVFRPSLLRQPPSAPGEKSIARQGNP